MLLDLFIYVGNNEKERKKLGDHGRASHWDGEIIEWTIRSTDQSYR